MNQPWPPRSPDMNESFKNAQAPKPDIAPPAQTVSKEEIEKMEKQIKHPAPSLDLKPPGMRQTSREYLEKVSRVERMKEELREKTEGKAQTRDTPDKEKPGPGLDAKKHQARDAFERER